jgi:hypothetical protein
MRRGRFNRCDRHVPSSQKASTELLFSTAVVNPFKWYSWNLRSYQPSWAQFPFAFPREDFYLIIVRIMTSSLMKPPALCTDCGHCNRGIPYHEPYLNCKHCSMDFCNECHWKHPDQHLRKQTVVVTCTPSSTVTPISKKRCCDCLKFIHCIFRCNECNKNWCFDCVDQKVESFDIHEHREFTCIREPGAELQRERDKHCTLCSISNSFTHCGSCRQGMLFFSVC